MNLEKDYVDVMYGVVLGEVLLVILFEFEFVCMCVCMVVVT